MAEENPHETLAKLLTKFRFAMLTTMDAEGKHLAHPLAVQEAEFDGDLWFVIAKDSTAVANIRRQPSVGVSLSSDDAWVSLSGTAELVDDRAKLEELWNKAIEAWFPNGIDDPNVGLLRFDADGAQYWHSPAGKLSTAIAYLTSRVTGEEPDTGESKKLDL